MVFEASQNWERNLRYPINLRVMVIKLPQGENFRENLPPYSPYLNKIEQRRLKVKESHPQKTGSV
jgi:hypothetical protein